MPVVRLYVLVNDASRFGYEYVEDGMRLALFCENWWKREPLSDLTYRRVVVNSITRTHAPDMACFYRKGSK